MKATFAILANTEVHNFVRKLAWDIHQKYRTGTSICRLPPHISLKQPFEISDLAALESYMSELAESIHPFEVKLIELKLIPATMEALEVGILWLDVQETDTLRQLHQRVNQELSRRFKNTQAAFDGMSYHFHMTVMIGGQSLEAYRRLYSEIPDHKVNLQYKVNELAMFVYDEPLSLNGDYLAYKILPISGKNITNHEAA
jgi:2'-5' RNA ligase